MKLTSRQEEIFSFVKTFIKEQGYPPSVREIGNNSTSIPGRFSITLGPSKEKAI